MAREDGDGGAFEAGLRLGSARVVFCACGLRRAGRRQWHGGPHPRRGWTDPVIRRPDPPILATSAVVAPALVVFAGVRPLQRRGRPRPRSCCCWMWARWRASKPSRCCRLPLPAAGWFVSRDARPRRAGFCAGLAGDGQIWSIDDPRRRGEVGAELNGCGAMWLPSERPGRWSCGGVSRAAESGPAPRCPDGGGDGRRSCAAAACSRRVEAPLKGLLWSGRTAVMAVMDGKRPCFLARRSCLRTP